MNILADENIDRSIIQFLRALGHDVYSIRESSPGTDDAAILQTGLATDRVILTFDLDFGELVFHQHLPTLGVVLLRIGAPSPDDLLARFQDCWPTIEQHAQGKFIVVSKDKLRIRPLR